jgi:hypothetical protein
MWRLHPRREAMQRGTTTDLRRERALDQCSVPLRLRWRDVLGQLRAEHQDVQWQAAPGLQYGRDLRELGRRMPDGVHRTRDMWSVHPQRESAPMRGRQQDAAKLQCERAVGKRHGLSGRVSGRKLRRLLARQHELLRSLPSDVR